MNVLPCSTQREAVVPPDHPPILKSQCTVPQYIQYVLQKTKKGTLSMWAFISPIIYTYVHILLATHQEHIQEHAPCQCGRSSRADLPRPVTQSQKPLVATHQEHIQEHQQHTRNTFRNTHLGLSPSLKSHQYMYPSPHMKLLLTCILGLLPSLKSLGMSVCYPVSKVCAQKSVSVQQYTYHLTSATHQQHISNTSATHQQHLVQQYTYHLLITNG